MQGKTLTPEEELAALRARISHLQSQEAALMLEVDGLPRPGLRPGWPIRRLGEALH